MDNIHVLTCGTTVFTVDNYCELQKNSKLIQSLSTIFSFHTIGKLKVTGVSLCIDRKAIFTEVECFVIHPVASKIPKTALSAKHSQARVIVMHIIILYFSDLIYE